MDLSEPDNCSTLHEGSVWCRADIVVVASILIGQIGQKFNEVPTVPIFYLVKPQPREWAWQNQRGKKTLLSLTLVQLCEET